MKKILFSSLIGFALVVLSGCTSGNDAEVMNANKCQASGKCGGDMAKKVAKKCQANGKCAQGKCGSSPKTSN